MLYVFSTLSINFERDLHSSYSLGILQIFCQVGVVNSQNDIHPLQVES